MSKLIMPPGLNEEEQGNWYFDHQEELATEYLASPESRNPKRGVAAALFGLPVILDVSGEDSKLARKQADRAGVDLHQYTAQVLHEALLERELRKAS